LIFSSTLSLFSNFFGEVFVDISLA
jgi:hypothetical protein